MNHNLITLKTCDFVRNISQKWLKLSEFSMDLRKQEVSFSLSTYIFLGIPDQSINTVRVLKTSLNLL